MTIDEYISKLNKQADEISSGKPLFLAVSSTVAEMSKRIFTQGKDSNDNEIGKYNTTEPLYVDPLLSPGKKFKTVGKTGKSKFASTGEPHKTGYFKSYKDYRDKIGFKTAFVNLTMSTELKKNFDAGVVRVSNDEYVLKVTKAINVDKVEGNESHFETTIFQTTPYEKKLYNAVFTDELLRITKL